MPNGSREYGCVLVAASTYVCNGALSSASDPTHYRTASTFYPHATHNAPPCAGHFLADEAVGERPALPPSINRLSFAAAAANTGPDGDPVVQLLNAALQLVELDSQRVLATPEDASPLVSVEMLGFLRRIAASFIMPDLSLYDEDGVSPHIQAAYGYLHDASDASGEGSGGGIHITDVVVRIGLLYLASVGPTEPSVATAALDLLHEFVSGTQVSCHAPPSLFSLRTTRTYY